MTEEFLGRLRHCQEFVLCVTRPLWSKDKTSDCSIKVILILMHIKSTIGSGYASGGDFGEF